MPESSRAKRSGSAIEVDSEWRQHNQKKNKLTRKKANDKKPDETRQQKFVEGKISI